MSGKKHTESEAREYLGGISRTAFFHIRRQYDIPVIRLGSRKMLFDTQDLDALCDEKKTTEGVK